MAFLMHIFNNRKFLIFTFSILFFTGRLIACTSPVYRYALERWQADPYRLYVIIDKKLNVSEKKIVDYLAEFEAAGRGIQLSVIDTSQKNVLPESLKKIISKCGRHKKPYIALLYPFTENIRRPAVTLPLNMNSAFSLYEFSGGENSGAQTYKRRMPPCL